MTPTVAVIQTVALVFLLGCSAFFSSAETALFSLNPIQVHRIRKRNRRGAHRVEALLHTPTRLLATLLIGNTLVNVAASIVGYALAEYSVHTFALPIRAEWLAIIVMPIILLIFGEVAPKRLAITYPERMATLYAPSLTFAAKALAPARVLLETFTHLFKKHFRPLSGGLTEEEFMSVIGASQEEGILDREERSMVHGIIRLEDIEASDVMTPRVDLIGIDVEDDPKDAEATARKTRFRYLPVYKENLDQIEGMLDVRSFLLSPDRNLDAAVIPPFHVPETAPLDTLLSTFQKEKRRIAIVVDEFGGTAGLITRGDVLEEISEEVENEYGEKKRTIEPLGHNRWLVDGSTSLEDINYELDMEIEEEGADRIAGWVAAQAEHLPKTGEVVEAQGCRATVRQVRRQRITVVVLEKIERPHEEDFEDIEDEED